MFFHYALHFVFFVTCPGPWDGAASLLALPPPTPKGTLLVSMWLVLIATRPIMLLVRECVCEWESVQVFVLPSTYMGDC